MKASVFISFVCALLMGCATKPPGVGGYLVQGKFNSVTVKPPTRWQPTWQHQFPTYHTLGLSLAGVVHGPDFTVRIDPARPIDEKGQRAIHDQFLAGYRQTFVAPDSGTVAVVPVNRRETFIQLYTGVDAHQYSAVIPLGRETVSFWLGDSHGESIQPYERDFIETVRSSSYR